MRLWGLTKPLIGVVHLQPLPGSPGYRGSLPAIVRRALRDAEAYLRGGMDALLVENYGDVPFFREAVPAETIAAMAAIAREIRRLGRFPLGVNVLRCDGLGALSVAMAAEAQFIRVNVFAGAMLTDQGLIQGRAADILRRRADLGASVQVWADLLVKHAVPLRETDPVAAAMDLKERALADGLIVTGSRTGQPADAALLSRLRESVGGVPWIVGSGVRRGELARYWHLADGFIVGTSLERGGRSGAAVDISRVRALVAERGRLLKNNRGPRTRSGGD
ncbi:MAG: BtpA/SgcQ family protein [Candidatus Eisenbacteria bacterium]